MALNPALTWSTLDQCSGPRVTLLFLWSALMPLGLSVLSQRGRVERSCQAGRVSAGVKRNVPVKAVCEWRDCLVR